LLAQAAELEEEKIALAEERRRALLGCHQAVLLGSDRDHQGVGSLAHSHAKISPSSCSGHATFTASINQDFLAKSSGSGVSGLAAHSRTFSTPSKSGAPIGADCSTALGDTTSIMSACRSQSSLMSLRADLELARSGHGHDHNHGFGSGHRQHPLWSNKQAPLPSPGITAVHHPSPGRTSNTVPASRPVLGNIGEAVSENTFSSGPMPPVYESAIAAARCYGWKEIHGSGPEWTALHWAAAEGRTDVCATLLSLRADPRHLDHAGRSALDHASGAGHKETWQLLAACSSTTEG